MNSSPKDSLIFLVPALFIFILVWLYESWWNESNKCENYKPWCNKVSDALSDTELQQFPHLFRNTNILFLHIDMGINLLSYVTASEIATARLLLIPILY